MLSHCSAWAHVSPFPTQRGRGWCWKEGFRVVGSCDKEGEESVHLWERCPFPSLLRARVLGNVEKEGPISAGGGGRDGDWGHCIMESTECRVRRLGSGLPVSRLGVRKCCSSSLGPGILICKTRALEPFLPKSVVLGHAQWWQGDLPPWDVD